MEEKLIQATQKASLTIPLYSMCNTGLCPGPCPYGLGWSWGHSLAKTRIYHMSTMATINPPVHD